MDPVGGLILHGFFEQASRGGSSPLDDPLMRLFMSSIPIRTVGTMFSPQARGMSDHLGVAYSEAGTGLR